MLADEAVPTNSEASAIHTQRHSSLLKISVLLLMEHRSNCAAVSQTQTAHMETAWHFEEMWHAVRACEQVQQPLDCAETTEHANMQTPLSAMSFAKLGPFSFCTTWQGGNAWMGSLTHL